MAPDVVVVGVVAGLAVVGGLFHGDAGLDLELDPALHAEQLLQVGLGAVAVLADHADVQHFLRRQELRAELLQVHVQHLVRLDGGLPVRPARAVHLDDHVRQRVARVELVVVNGVEEGAALPHADALRGQIRAQRLEPVRLAHAGGDAVHALANAVQHGLVAGWAIHGLDQLDANLAVVAEHRDPAVLHGLAVELGVGEVFAVDADHLPAVDAEKAREVADHLPVVAHDYGGVLPFADRNGCGHGVSSS